MLTINQLQKRFGDKTAVDIENYTIAPGTLLGLVGNNGAGKTTLFRLILDLLQADRGNVTVDGIDVSRSEDWKTFTGAYIDDGFLIDYLTPEEYFYFIGRMYGLRKEEVDERLRPFDRFMNGEVTGQKKFIRNYSMGNKQKIGIISAMLHHPRLLILDEPFNFLDPSSQAIIKHLLQRYNEEHGATVLISSHNLNHTVDICPRIDLQPQPEPHGGHLPPHRPAGARRHPARHRQRRRHGREGTGGLLQRAGGGRNTRGGSAGGNSQ